MVLTVVNGKLFSNSKQVMCMWCWKKCFSLILKKYYMVVKELEKKKKESKKIGFCYLHYNFSISDVSNFICTRQTIPHDATYNTEVQEKHVPTSQ